MGEVEVLQHICYLPIYFRHMNLSLNTLVERSGYFDMPQVLTREHVSNYLREHPNLISNWEAWMEDLRTSPAWVCGKRGERYVVYRIPPEGEEMIFDNQFDAWAEFIVRWTLAIARYARPNLN